MRRKEQCIMEQNKEIQVTIIVATYYPDYTKLQQTIKSVVLQKNVKLEILVADDGSECNYFSQLIELFESYDFTDYVLLESKTNMGTCQNIYRALKIAKGEFVKFISPGDYLYGDDVLSQWYLFMKENDVDISFGDVVYYNTKKHNLNIMKVHTHPQVLWPYKKTKYSERAVKLNYLLLCDASVGAAYMGKTYLLQKYLKFIVGKVKYAEDFMYRLMIADGVRLWYFPHVVLWYEYETGISTNKESKWARLLAEDLESANKVMVNVIEPKDKFIKRFFKMLEDKSGNRIKNYIMKSVMFPDYIFWIFIRKIKKNYSTTNVKMDFYSQITTK